MPNSAPVHPKLHDAIWEVLSNMDGDTSSLLQANAVYEAAVPLYAPLLEALKEIAKGEGPYSRDPLTHAANTIKAMTENARAAIAKAEAV